MTLKLSRAELARPRAEAAVDNHFRPQIAAVMGPFAALHAIKRAQAEAGGGTIVGDEADRQAILARATEQDAALARIEARRLAIKRAIREARTKAEIDAILAELSSS